MVDIYDEIVSLRKRGDRGALATVIATEGSTPRKQGAKMLVLVDGSTMGTVGGSNLGRLIFEGQAEPNTGIPGIIDGYGAERVLWSPGEGHFTTKIEIGTSVAKGDVVTSVSGQPVLAQISGVIRGLLHDGLVGY